MKGITELAPGFLEANTDAAFTLFTARFYVMAADGKVQEAVPFARAHLAPLVRDNAARTDQMKVSSLMPPCNFQQVRTWPFHSATTGLTLVRTSVARDMSGTWLLRASLVQVQNALADALIPAASARALRSCINGSSISARITEALEVALGLREPQLVQLLRVRIPTQPTTSCLPGQ